jgi:hypothetical protein
MTWFSRFLLKQYDDQRWVQMFQMTKPAVFALADLLSPHVKKQDSKYKLAVPVIVRFCCTLFKLTHGASLFICSEMFAVGKTIVSLLLREIVHAINDALRHEISWPTGECLFETQAVFQEICGLLAVVGAIEGTYISISKSKYGPANYFYFKSGDYTLNCQAIVDSKKHFLHLYLGMSGSTNDARVLRRSSLYQKAMHDNLFDARFGVDGFAFYLLDDSGYLLLLWLMVPHRGHGQFLIADSLFNRRLRQGRCVVEDAFGIMKQTFRELLVKSELHVVFLPDVIICSAILYNVLFGQSHEEVEQLLQVLWNEGLDGEVLDEDPGPVDFGDALNDDTALAQASEKCLELGVYLSLQRQYKL